MDPNAVPETPVTPTAPVVPEDVYLKAAGLVEIVNADGSKSQVTKEVAAAMVANLENLKAQLATQV